MSNHTQYDQPVSVVLITDSLGSGGAERTLADMANYWAKTGLRVVLVSIKGAEILDFYSLDSRVKRIHLRESHSGNFLISKATATLKHIAQLRSVLRRENPTAVLSFTDRPNVISILAATKLPFRLVVSERGCADQDTIQPTAPWSAGLPGYWRWLRKRLYVHADAVTALNSDTANWISNECGVEVCVIPNAIRPLPMLTRSRESVILGIGRLHAVKGFDVLLNSFAKIAARYPEWRLMLLGSGPEKAALQSLCTSLNIQDQVEFVGVIQDIESWMSRAGLVVAPSRYEAFGNAILESMAMGTPVISSRCAGPSSIIRDNIDGRLVPIGDVVILAQTMDELLSAPSERARLGTAALAVRQRFEQEKIMRKWNEILF